MKFPRFTSEGLRKIIVLVKTNLLSFAAPFSFVLCPVCAIREAVKFREAFFGCLWTGGLSREQPPRKYPERP